MPNTWWVSNTGGIVESIKDKMKSLFSSNSEFSVTQNPSFAWEESGEITEGKSHISQFWVTSGPAILDFQVSFFFPYWTRMMTNMSKSMLLFINKMEIKLISMVPDTHETLRHVCYYSWSFLNRAGFEGPSRWRDTKLCEDRWTWVITSICRNRITKDNQCFQSFVR